MLHAHSVAAVWLKKTPPPVEVGDPVRASAMCEAITPIAMQRNSQFLLPRTDAAAGMPPGAARGTTTVAASDPSGAVVGASSCLWW
eukprot:353796-Chlamydomonas_euryale.AAC.5